MEAFPHQVCINLERRPDRWRRVSRRFAAHRIDGVLRFPAVDGRAAPPPPEWPKSRGAWGCLQSHLAVVRLARDAGWESVFIFEDDVVLAPRLGRRLGRVLEQLPADWDMLSLGGIHQDDPITVTPHLVRATKLFSTHAYALRNTLYEPFLAVNGAARCAVDVSNAMLQKHFNCYCAMPHLAWQEDGYSDVEESPQSHWEIEHSVVMEGAAMDRAVASAAAILFHHGGASPAVLARVAASWAESLPALTLAVVEHGAAPRLDPARHLGAGCRYRFLPGAAPFDRGPAFNAGLELLADRHRLLLFADGDLLAPTSRALRAGLRIAERYDLVSFFRQLITDAADDRRRAGREAAQTAATPLPACGGACLFRRSALEGIGGWLEGRPDPDGRRQSRLAGALRVFRCPDRGVRLRAGDPAEMPRR